MCAYAPTPFRFCSPPCDRIIAGLRQIVIRKRGNLGWKSPGGTPPWIERIIFKASKKAPHHCDVSLGFTARGVELSGGFDMSKPAESEAAIYKHIIYSTYYHTKHTSQKGPAQKNPENYISNQNHRFNETSTSWWFRPSWKIFVKLDDVPTLGIKNKKNELPPPSPKLRPTKFPSNISVHRPGDSLRFPPRISTKDSLLIAPWLVTDWCQAVSQQKNPRSLMD